MARTPEGTIDVEVIRQRFADAQAHGRITVMPPLPRRVRVRLWFTNRADGVAVWLVEHRRFRAAIAVWRACRMW
jgi:hypothetical protein